MLDSNRGQRPAVDVAWLSDQNQRFPLMIFEVESSAGNTIASNPLKVFAQATTEFEKPLFYFQIVVRGKAETSRVDLLERQYGTFNYRLYSLGRGECDKLLYDILRQHRRIRSEIPYTKVFDVLVDECWSSYCNPVQILDEAYEIGLSKESRLSDYIWLALTEESIRERMPSLIAADAELNWNETCSVETYMAKCFGPELLCAWLLGYDEEANHDWEGEWRAFCSHLNDDSFTLPFGGSCVGCLLGLCRGRGHTIQELVTNLCSVLNSLEAREYGLHLASWLCHLAAALNREKDFDTAQDYLEQAGGIPMIHLLTPPSHCALEVNIREEYFHGAPSDRMGIAEFAKEARQLHSSRAHDRSAIAFRVLNLDGYVFDWADDVLAAIWSK